MKAVSPRTLRRAAILALALQWPAAALAQSAPAQPLPAIPSKAVPGTHDCAKFYPEAALNSNESGDVLVSYDVGADGAISNVRVVKTSGHPVLDRAAVVCVSTAWRNTPAELGGIKIASPGHQAIIRFALTEPTPRATPAPPPVEPEEGSDLVLLLGAGGLVVLIIAAGVIMLYRRRRRPAAGRDEES